jgi:hypothetical protein
LFENVNKDLDGRIGLIGQSQVAQDFFRSAEFQEKISLTAILSRAQTKTSMFASTQSGGQPSMSSLINIGRC